MKNNLMILCLIPMFFSCVVSKKKYEELEYAKRRSDARIGVLKKDVDTKDKKINSLDSKMSSLLSEFNDMKNNMSESNAMKTSEIDALSSKVNGLSSSSAVSNQRLASAKMDNERLEREKLLTENKIALLQSQILSYKQNASQAKESLETKIQAIDWLKRKHAAEITVRDEKIKEAENAVLTVNTKLAEEKSKNARLNRIISANKAEISKLSNQVKLYKTQ